MIIPKTYLLLDRCIEEGVRYGLNRAYKHTDSPTREHMENEIAMAIMHEITEWFEIKQGVDNEADTY